MTTATKGQSPLSNSLSVYLDLLRFLAAMVVFLLHASFHRFTGGLPGLWRLSVFGNDAVMLFFVLSGFVIAHVTSRDAHSWKDYSAARLSRLWSICIPALVLTAALDAVGMRLAPDLYAFAWYEYDEPVARLLASLLFLNELWFYSIQPFSNTPYWSVGYEFWYYVLFGVALFLRGRQQLAALGLVALVMGPKILLLLPVWLAGVWAYRTALAQRLPRAAALALCLGTLGVYLAYRLLGGAEWVEQLSTGWLGPTLSAKLGWSANFLGSYVVGALVALHFVGARRLLDGRHGVPLRLEAPIRYLASLTFALYLFHNPLLQFFAALAHWLGAWGYQRFIIVLGPLLVVLLIGRWAETRKTPLKRLLLRALRARPGVGRLS